MKNSKASFYRRRWFHMTSKISRINLEIELVKCKLKLFSKMIDSDALCDLVSELGKLKEKRKAYHTCCKKYKLEFLINNK